MDYISTTHEANSLFDKEHTYFLNYIERSSNRCCYSSSPVISIDEQEFYRACFTGDFESASVILKLGINLNKRFDHGRTLLHIACIKNFYGLVKLLIKFGCNEYIKDNYSRTALHYAAMKGSDAIVRYLVERNTFNVSRSDYLNESIELTKEFLNLKDVHGKTALYYACDKNHLKCVEYILANTNNLVDINIYDESDDKHTALDVTYEKQYWDLFELLIKYGACVSGSVLRELCSKGNLGVVNILLRYTSTTSANINWNQIDENNNTPIFFAFKYSFNIELIKRLLDHSLFMSINDIQDFIENIKELSFVGGSTATATKSPQEKLSIYIEYVILLYKYGYFTQYAQQNSSVAAAAASPSTSPTFFTHDLKSISASMLDTVYTLYMRSDTQTQQKLSYRIIFMFALAIYSKQLAIDGGENAAQTRKWLNKIQKQTKLKALHELFNDSTKQPWSLQTLCRCTIRNDLGIKELKNNNVPNLPYICAKYLQFEYI